jgi:hypothetical protein
MWVGSYLPQYSGLSFYSCFQYKPYLFYNRELTNGQKIDTYRVDHGTSPHVEGTRKKENPGWKYRPHSQTNGRRDAAEGIQPWSVVRLTRLKISIKDYALSNKGPVMYRGFCTL